MGEILNISIDQRNYSVEFWVDGIFRIKRLLLDEFRNNRMYPFICLQDVGDTV